MNAIPKQARADPADVMPPSRPAVARMGPMRSRYRFPKASVATAAASFEPAAAVAPVAGHAAEAPAVPNAIKPLPITLDPDKDLPFIPYSSGHRSLLFRIARAGLLAFAVFAVLSGALIATMWVDDNGGMDATIAMLLRQTGDAGPKPVVATAPPQGELPYDGMPADKAAQARVARQAVPDSAVPAAAAQASANDSAHSLADTKHAIAASPDVQAPMSSGDAGTVASAQAATAAKQGASKTSKAPAHHAAGATSVQRVARGREISRIQQQAAEELKKKTRAGRRGALARQSSRARHGKLAALAQCTAIGNLFRRELCKWQVCGNSWGRSGCPSYGAQVAANGQ